MTEELVSPRNPMRIHYILATFISVVGIMLISYAVFTVFGHQGAVRDNQAQLKKQWSLPLGEQVGIASAGGLVKPPKPLPGDALARLFIPSLNQSWIVVEGTAPEDIVAAPGHYTFSAMPGQKGNFAIAGHREKGIFWDLDRVKQGDRIVVETRKATYTYIVTRNFITSPQSWPEVSATPPGFKTGNKILTLTTCNPKWDNYQRLVVHAVLQS